MRVLRCGHAATGGKYCPECGQEQTTDAPSPADVFVGRTIVDRYRVLELLDVGGMGRVYKAVQTSLDRPVAIKVIHPHLLTSDEIVGRFLTEARASSRLNHPNVVSIYDFGRAPPSEGGHLFLVMELLSGRDLRAEMSDGALPIAQIADLLRQILAALGEAHHVGITHRDVKPENVLLEARRRGRGQSAHHVKVIDFGIARMGGDARKTAAGRIFGTPWYMAPEQANGSEVGPSADLYAVGVLLFEMLAGRVPFDDAAPTSILLAHTSAPRPDPRDFATRHDIPEDLAKVCVRAMSIDPHQRFPDAESFAAAIVQTATSESWSAGKASMFPRKTIAPSTPAREAAAKSAALGVDAARGEAPLVGRSADVAKVRALLAEGPAVGVVVHGRAGVGRTRLLEAVVKEERAAGGRVIALRAPPRPGGETSFGGVARIAAALTGTRPTAHSANDARAALEQAFHTALARAEGARVLVAIDDVHELDPVSQHVIMDLFEARAVPPEIALVMTSETAPELGLASHLRGHALRGLSRADAAKLSGGDVTLPDALGDDVEPLFVEALRRFRKIEAPEDAPASLAGLVSAWMRGLPPGRKRLIQALGVVGGASLRLFSEILPRPEDLDDALRPLSEAGVVVVEDGDVRLRNAIHGRVAVQDAPAGAITELHARALAALEHAANAVELRAYHALRAEPTFETFMVVEEAARLRAAFGSDEAVLALLFDAMNVARAQELRGDADAQVATSARLVFGRKLGDALIHAGRFEQAHGILSEILELAPPKDVARAHVLERLSTIAHHRGRGPEADQWRAEALAIADRAKDGALQKRLRAGPQRVATQPPRQMVFRSSAPPSSRASRA